MPRRDNIEKTLVEIEVALGKISVHLEDIKEDLHETKGKLKESDKRLSELENFKSRTLGAAMILAPLVAFGVTIGHEIIKKLLGWG